MKKKIIGAALIAAMAIAAGWNYNQSKQSVEMSDLALANVEALANPEFNVDDLVANCYWREYETCYYLIVTPSGNTVWSNSNMDERN